MCLTSSEIVEAKVSANPANDASIFGTKSTATATSPTNMLVNIENCMASQRFTALQHQYGLITSSASVPTSVCPIKWVHVLVRIVHKI